MRTHDVTICQHSNNANSFQALKVSAHRRLCTLRFSPRVGVATADIAYISSQMHTSDLLNVYGPGDMTDYLIRFVANLDPNGKSGIYWPEYTTQFPSLLTFLDGPVPLKITQDTYRVDATTFLTEFSLAHPI